MKLGTKFLATACATTLAFAGWAVPAAYGTEQDPVEPVEQTQQSEELEKQSAPESTEESTESTEEKPTEKPAEKKQEEPAPSAATQSTQSQLPSGAKKCDYLINGNWTLKDDIDSESPVPYTAPSGKLVDKYCVKAGSENQPGGGAFIIDVDPNAKNVTIKHPYKNSVSHFAVLLVDKPNDDRKLPYCVWDAEDDKAKIVWEKSGWEPRNGSTIWAQSDDKDDCKPDKVDKCVAKDGKYEIKAFYDDGDFGWWGKKIVNDDKCFKEYLTYVCWQVVEDKEVPASYFADPVVFPSTTVKTGVRSMPSFPQAFVYQGKSWEEVLSYCKNREVDVCEGIDQYQIDEYKIENKDDLQELKDAIENDLHGGSKHLPNHDGNIYNNRHTFVQNTGETCDPPVEYCVWKNGDWKLKEFPAGTQVGQGRYLPLNDDGDCWEYTRGEVEICKAKGYSYELKTAEWKATRNVAQPEWSLVDRHTSDYFDDEDNVFPAVQVGDNVLIAAQGDQELLASDCVKVKVCVDGDKGWTMKWVPASLSGTEGYYAPLDNGDCWEKADGKVKVCHAKRYGYEYESAWWKAIRTADDPTWRIWERYTSEHFGHDGDVFPAVSHDGTELIAAQGNPALLDSKCVTTKVCVMDEGGWDLVRVPATEAGNEGYYPPLNKDGDCELSKKGHTEVCHADGEGGWEYVPYAWWKAVKSADNPEWTLDWASSHFSHEDDVFNGVKVYGTTLIEGQNLEDYGWLLLKRDCVPLVDGGFVPDSFGGICEAPNGGFSYNVTVGTLDGPVRFVLRKGEDVVETYGPFAPEDNPTFGHDDLEPGTYTLTAETGFPFARSFGTSRGFQQEVDLSHFTYEFTIDNPSDCADIDESSITAQCVEGVPVVTWDVDLNDPFSELTGEAAPTEVTITFSKEGFEPWTTTIPIDAADYPLWTGTFDWPGYTEDPEGNSLTWPGWDFVDGFLQDVGDDNYGWTRSGATVTVQLNPEVIIEGVVYPTASGDCGPAEPTIDGTILTPECSADAPWINYQVLINDPHQRVNPAITTATITFLNPDGENHVMVVPLSKEWVLWPGASVAPAPGLTAADIDPEDPTTFVATDWPGWFVNSAGEWEEYTDEQDNFKWTRNGVDVMIEVNPSTTVTVQYPPPTDACVAGPDDEEEEIEDNVLGAPPLEPAAPVRGVVTYAG
ncbi:hypothetical protein [Demequina sp. NBRC 110056]|uniref:hypothetical protein n=1 Tax=Demequina sp. NBRC 110056 TaxID=1570345 RepID=UPI000A066F1E|nr:hypothetical protein [Demequina sp. NBRC 110056]